MRFRSFLVVGGVIVWAAGALAQPLTMGNPFQPGVGHGSPTLPGAVTLIDLAHPATADGTIVRASFAIYAFGGDCRRVATLKFFRRQGEGLTLVAERGPFDAIGDTTLFPITPSVNVLAGDLIGITRMPWDPNDPCFGLVVMNGGGEYLQYATDVSGTVDIAAGAKASGLAVVAAFGAVGGPTSRQVASVLPLVGSIAGGMGARWMTSVQVTNPYAVPVAGRLVLRRAGIGGTSADPSLPYALEAGGTTGWPDVVAAMGASGLGSIDVVVEKGPPPLVVAEIFNGSAVEAPTIVEEPFDPRELRYPARVLHAGFRGALIAPDPSGARYNIGVRTLAAGATIRMGIEAVPGEPRFTATRSLPPDYFEQLPADAFLGSPPRGGESIVFEVEQGSAIVYATTIENETNEAAMEFVESHFLLPKEERSLVRR